MENINFYEKMETINLKRIWEIFCIFEKVEEENEKVLLKYDTFYSHSYEDFLEWWSFKIDLEKEEITVYNNDFVPYENNTWNMFNTFPIKILEMTDLEIKEWCLEEGKREYGEAEEHRKKSLLREIESCKSILERDFGMKFE